jgi:predicted ferric reductase
MASVFLRYVCLILVLSLGSLYFYAASVDIKVFKSPTGGFLEFLQIWSGIMAFVAMTVSLLLSTKLRLINNFFGGLDKSYWIHKLNGYFIALLVLIHFTKVSGTFEKNKLFVSTLHREATNLGNLLFWMIIILIAATIIKKIGNKTLLTYGAWKVSHKLFIAVYLGVSFHFLAINKPYAGGSSIDNFLIITAIVGLVSLFYRGYSTINYFDYKISELEFNGEVTKLVISPVGRKKLTPKPGQFAFLSFPKVPGKKEKHPFTIAKSDADGSLTFYIKSAGDFTSSLNKNLNRDVKVRVEGPHGKFALTKKSGRRSLWIAGGIGITPFIAFASSNHTQTMQSSLLYVVKSRNQALEVDTFTKLANANKAFNFNVIVTSEDGRPTVSTITSLIPADCKEVDVYFCGPTSLRKSIVEHLRLANIKINKMKYEVFAFR